MSDVAPNTPLSPAQLFALLLRIASTRTRTVISYVNVIGAGMPSTSPNVQLSSAALSNS